MGTHETKIGVSNHFQGDRPHVVCVEPWGEDYTLLPHEELTIIARGSHAVPWFHLVESEGATQVYCEDTDDFEVLQGGRPIACGHKRQHDA